MTAFVRSILPKRNPRNVPLDLFPESGEPYPGVWWDETLSPEEKQRQIDANLHHLKNVRPRHVRIAEGQEAYRGIFREAVQSIASRIYKLESGDLTNAHTPKQWQELGEQLAGAVRDALAAQFAAYVETYELYRSGKTIRKGFGPKTFPKKYTGAELRDALEIRAELLGRWIRARAAFESKRQADYLVHAGESASKRTAEAQGALRAARGTFARIQSEMAQDTGNSWSAAYGAILEGIRDLAGIAAVLGSPGLRSAVGNYMFVAVTELRSETKKAETLAAKGERGMSRKLAREAAIREGDELKQNPFVRGILRYA